MPRNDLATPRHLVLPYLELLGVHLAEAEGHVVDRQGDLLGVGDHAAAPVVILHSDGEGDEGGVVRAEAGQPVDAGAHEIVAAPVEGGVMGVAGGHADGAALGHALPHALHHGAPLARLATGLLAHHHAQIGVAPAPRLAGLVGPKLFTGTVVTTVVGAAAAGHRHALAAAEDVALVAGAGFDAGLGASGGRILVGARGRAGVAAGFVVAVFGAG